LSNTADEARQKFLGIFDELAAKVFNRSLDIKKIERLNIVAAKFAATVQTVASRTALERCKALNDATKSGFGKVAEDMAALEKRIVELEGNVSSDREVNDG
jgi:DNA polymerase III delta prime subunit